MNLILECLEGFILLEVVVISGNFECVEFLIRSGVLIDKIKNGFFDFVFVVGGKMEGDNEEELYN